MTIVGSTTAHSRDPRAECVTASTPGSTPASPRSSCRRRPPAARRRPSRNSSTPTPEDEPVTVKLLGVPYDANSSFLRGPALAPSAIRAALTCGSANWCTESGIDLDPTTNDEWTDLGDLELPDDAADAVKLIHRLRGRRDGRRVVAAVARWRPHGHVATRSCCVRPRRRAHDPALRRPSRPVRRSRRRPLLARMSVRPDHGGGQGGQAGATRHPHDEPAPARPGRPLRRRGPRTARLGAAWCLPSPGRCT